MRIPIRRTRSQGRRTVALAAAAAATTAVALIPAASAGARTSGPVARAASAPTTISSATKGKLAHILVNASGDTLYAFSKDPRGRSECNGTCAAKWVPVLGQSAAGRSGVNSRLLGITVRSNGYHQVTYDHHPLYRYVGDKSSRTTNGEGANQYGGFWYVVNTAGTEVKPKSSGSCDPVCGNY